jgi:hypothetical protein
MNVRRSNIALMEIIVIINKDRIIVYSIYLIIVLYFYYRLINYHTLR